MFIICSTIVFAQNKIFWDLGISIEPKQSPVAMKPLISDTKIIPKYKEYNNHEFIIYLEDNFSQKQIIALLYAKERYAELIKYTKRLEQSNIVLTNDESYIVEDALYRLGKYSDAIIKLSTLMTVHSSDEQYFLAALCNKKIGNIIEMKKMLTNLINECPNSEYIKLAKIQTNILN